MTIWTRLLALLVLAVGIAFDTSAALVDINSSQILARARDGVGVTLGDLYNGLDNNLTTTLDAASGSNSAQTAINWSGDSNSQVFDFGFTHTRGPAWNSFAKSDAFDLTFTTNAAATYDLAGAYNTNASGGTTLFSASLLDVTDGIYLFRNIQENRGIIQAPSNFSLGGTDGNWGSVTLEGALSGALIAGHQYRFHFDALIQTVPANDQGASATGFARMTINVPGPASLLILLVGLGMGYVAGRPSGNRQQ